ncbi:DUF1206 domain-containing protein [Planosporangium flavigriseum]|uniref:DUF1206 domain-containing protein n=1 Tax=Planosporangium flavigriseum TaxID=373681 RepID=A0A8J3LML3_9ACTN|nr:DUF1206 domain-containing protein [Planosporangium flavigriseum]NJC67118.1 DUF1206 domain-containing protein [Planosporangium flavigriseum]GIG75522.1 hypothetical protein Pfl04_39260 [Planosporangium flavigriseum]
MTVAQSARRTARQAARSGTLETLTRIGFVGYGLLHLAVAWIAVQLALGHPSGESDQAGAFRYLADQPFGRFLLMVTVIGLAAMAVWQLLLVFVGHREEHGFSRTAERVASAFRTLVYAALAWTAYQVVVGTPTSNAEQTEKATAGLMSRPAGLWLVALAGVAVVATGLGLVVYGARRKFEKRLLIAQMGNSTRLTAVRLGQLGYVAKGVAFGIVGVLLFQAVTSHNPAKSRGLDAALRLLVSQPYGPVLLILIALGLAAFGAYCFFQARYRKVCP